ncbi:hypothetical protein BD408DRAFT_426298 [Parasitella parasitica]|nr:hypothetical protein BD408DRAFT_426298 [Parasitella parasitica]
MNSINYNSINEIHYPIADPPDPLQRYCSGHLDQDIFGISVYRSNNAQQQTFVRKVITIATLQFVLLSIMIFFIVQICPLFEWLKNSTYVWYIPLIPIFILSIIVIWQLYSQYFHLSVPTRITLLCIYSLFITTVVSNIVSKLLYKEGISVIIMAIYGLSCLLLCTFQNRFPFRGAFPFVCSLGAVCLCSLWLRKIYTMDPLEILFPITAASLICIYVILELFYIMRIMTKDDYLLANVYLFVDLVYPIRFIHHFCELTDHMNVFPDILYPGESRF